MRREYHFYVYTRQSASRRGLFIDMSNNLPRRVWQRKAHGFEGFTDDYHDARLVYWQSFDDACKAINRDAAEELAVGKEPAVDRNHEPALARPCCRLVRNCSDRAEAGSTQGSSTVAPVHLVNERPRSG
jgi:predicted GIY-YIG superfamily endonuclease